MMFSVYHPKLGHHKNRDLVALAVIALLFAEERAQRQRADFNFNNVTPKYLDEQKILLKEGTRRKIRRQGIPVSSEELEKALLIARQRIIEKRANHIPDKPLFWNPFSRLNLAEGVLSFARAA